MTKEIDHIQIVLSPQEKQLIKLVAKKLGIGHSTLCKIKALEFSREFIQKNRGVSA